MPALTALVLFLATANPNAASNVTSRPDTTRRAVPQESTPPECHQTDGNVACGFHCKWAFGKIACAQTQAGFCTDVEGEIACWDPPASVVLHPASKSRTPECKRRGNQIACGYKCTGTSTDVACAQTPYGVCITRGERVVCWDPSDDTIAALAPNLPKPECTDFLSPLACGYHCDSSRNSAACAQTPSGVCRKEDDNITCWDPPLLVRPEATYR